MRDEPEHPHPVDAERVARARRRVPTRLEARRISRVLTLLADPTRARVLDEVEGLCVGDVALALDLNDDAAGYALRVLRTSGVMQRRKDGRVAYYRLAIGFPGPLLVHCLRSLVDLSSDAPED